MHASAEGAISAPVAAAHCRIESQLAVRARPDNLSLVDPATQAGVDASRFDFDELWEHRESLRAICLRMAGDPTTADDVVQETFVRALTHATTLDKRASFGPWLATVARRRSVDEIRLRRRVRPVAATPDMEIGAAEDPAEQVLKQEMVRRLRIALGELSTRERQLLLRQVTHGLSLAELAQEEDTSIASVRSVLNRARTKLRGSLERGGPLGAAPLPRLVTAVKRRLQGVAARLEGHAPLFGGAGAQLGDVVAAVIAAVALLAGGAATPDGTSLVTVPAVVSQPSVVDAPPYGATPGQAHASSEAGPPEGPSTAGGDEQPAEAADPLPLPDGGNVSIPLPPIPGDGADQPEDAGIESLAASPDGSVVFASGGTNESGQLRPALFKSTDGGTSWVRVGERYQGQAILVPPTYPRYRTVFTTDNVTGLQLIRSDDDGVTFSSTAAVASNTTAMAFVPDFEHDPRILIATNPLSAYDVSMNRVIPLPTALPSQELGDIVAGDDFARTGRILVAGMAPSETSPAMSSVFECTTAEGCQRRTMLPGVASPPRLHRSQSTGLFLAGTRHQLRISSDGGRTFSVVPVPANFYISTIVDGAPGEVLVGGLASNGQATLFRWTAATQTWTPLGRGTKLDKGTEAVLRLPSGRLIADPSHGTGVLCSADDGITWATRCTA
jgi:RNA polymerase sigma-70 factor (ECF subfamily)